MLQAQAAAAGAPPPEASASSVVADAVVGDSSAVSPPPEASASSVVADAVVEIGPLSHLGIHKIFQRPSVPAAAEAGAGGTVFSVYRIFDITFLARTGR